MKIARDSSSVAGHVVNHILLQINIRLKKTYDARGAAPNREFGVEASEISVDVEADRSN